jgi:hypothetical protein
VAIIERNDPELHQDAIHGLIEYDSGPGTPVRNYIHVNSYITDKIMTKAWWYQTLKRTGFDALILKAATGGFEAYDAINLGQDVINTLARHNGVFVDGDGMFHQIDDQARLLGARKHDLPDFGGYSSGTVTVFGAHR